MKRLKGLCQNCVRYHPKAAGNCVWAKGYMSLENRHGYKLMVVDCPAFVPPEEVFPEKPKKREKSEDPKTGEDEGLA